MNNKIRFEVYVMFIDGSAIFKAAFDSGKEAKEYMNNFNEKVIIGGKEKAYQLKVQLVKIK